MEVRLPLILAAAGLALGPSGAVSYAYKKVYLDDPSVCNGTLRLHDGQPAALVRLSPGQLGRPLTCSVEIEVVNSPVGPEGLSVVVQELNVGKFDDPSNCTSFLKVTMSGRSQIYTERLCGEWRSALHHLEPRKSLFGACGPAMDQNAGRDYRCTARKVNLQAHVPRLEVGLQPSLEVVVTAFYSPDLFIRCGAGRFECQNRDAAEPSEQRCISQRLVCDGYPNCGFVDNQDEYSSTCSRRTGTLTESDHFFATWAGFAVIVLLLVVAVSYFIRSVRWTTSRQPGELRAGRTGRPPPPPRPGAPEPPPYEALYPQGPPSGFLEKKRERAGAEEAAAPPPPAPRPAPPRSEPPPRHALQQGGARGAGAGAGAGATHIYVEPEPSSPEEPPPYTERPALRHSVLLAEAVP